VGIRKEREYTLSVSKNALRRDWNEILNNITNVLKGGWCVSKCRSILSYEKELVYAVCMCKHFENAQE
jgi:hypothetical protein